MLVPQWAGTGQCGLLLRWPRRQEPQQSPGGGDLSGGRGSGESHSSEYPRPHSDISDQPGPAGHVSHNPSQSSNTEYFLACWPSSWSGSQWGGWRGGSPPWPCSWSSGRRWPAWARTRHWTVSSSLLTISDQKIFIHFTTNILQFIINFVSNICLYSLIKTRRGTRRSGQWMSQMGQTDRQTDGLQELLEWPLATKNLHSF